MKRFCCILFVLLSFVSVGVLSGAEEGEGRSVNVTAEVDRERANIGDRIKLGIVVEKTEGFEVSFPETLENPGDFFVVGSRPVKRGWPKAREEGREYVLTIYETGTHVIPPVRVRYKETGADEWLTAESPQVPIEVVSLLTGDDTDIRDLKGLAVSPRGFLPLLIVFLALALVSGAAWWLLRRGKAKRAAAEAVEKKSAYDIAHEQLLELKAMDLPGKGRVKEYYTRLSGIARHYLENRFSFRAPEMTTEEFMEAVKASPEMLREHRELLKDFLSRCDMVKFAKYGPTPLEMLDSYRSAERLIEQTKVEEEGEWWGKSKIKNQNAK